VDDVSIKRARAAKARALDEFSRLGRVVGVGLTRLGGSYAVKVNLAEPLADGIDAPTSIDGVEVRVAIVGAIRPRRA
jgi:hypothetical protein